MVWKIIEHFYPFRTELEYQLYQTYHTFHKTVFQKPYAEYNNTVPIYKHCGRNSDCEISQRPHWLRCHGFHNRTV